MVKVLFVCLGNICRSPTAHGVFEKLVQDEAMSHLIEVDSAGTAAYHVGNEPDRRAQQAARRRGIELSHLRARQAVADDFYEFDYVLAMDHENYHNLARICPTGMEHKLQLFLEYAHDFSEEAVPDPYYGGADGFEYVLDMVQNGAEGLLDHIRKTHFKN